MKKQLLFASLLCAAAFLSGCASSENDSFGQSSEAAYSSEVCLAGKSASFHDFARILHNAGFERVTSCSNQRGKVTATVSYYDCECNQHLFRVRLTLREHGSRKNFLDLSSTGPQKAGEKNSESAHRLIKKDERLYTAKISLSLHG